MTQARRKTTTYGFKKAAGLVEGRIKAGASARGFAVTRLLTHWPEIVGQDVAQSARPVDVNYGRGSIGATLTVLTTGAQAPMLEMQKEMIRERVNTCYGYAAIARVRITQTAPTGFAEGQVAFEAPKAKTTPEPCAEVVKAAKDASSEVGDAGLRDALASLGANVMGQTRSKR